MGTASTTGRENQDPLKHGFKHQSRCEIWENIIHKQPRNAYCKLTSIGEAGRGLPKTREDAFWVETQMDASLPNFGSTEEHRCCAAKLEPHLEAQNCASLPLLTFISASTQTRPK